MDNLFHLKRVASYENTNGIGTLAELENKFNTEFGDKGNEIFLIAYRTYDTSIRETKWKYSIAYFETNHQRSNTRVIDSNLLNLAGSLWVYSLNSRNR